ncbi:MAG: right-handed parallel beta-helix repeat-containing protein [Phycisphaerae bacterium]|nr:right-handed parallel beta-helix repeat-containing protein [Phycisphaerae bacterium]
MNRQSSIGYVSKIGILILSIAAVQCGGLFQPEPNTPDTPNTPNTPDPNLPSTTYYVAPDGNDANPGTQNQPWASPGYASRQLAPGDTLVVLAGKYVLSEFDADILTPPSGTQNAWITIKGQDGNRPVLAGRDDLSHAVDLSGASYVRLENLEITHDDQATGAAVYFRDGLVVADSPADHVVLNQLYIHHLDEFGLDLQDVDGLEVFDCRIEYCGFGAIGGPMGQAGGLTNLVIKDSRLSYSGHYYQGTDGANRPYDRPDGFGIEPSNGPVEIARTVAEHNQGDGLDSKARNTHIHECIVSNNACDGIKLWGDGSKIVNCLIYGAGDGVGGASPWAGIVIGTDHINARFDIINTTLHDNPTRQAYPMYVQYEDTAPITVVMRNTIIAGAYGPVFFGNSVTLTADHNLFLRGGNESVQVELAGNDYTSTNIESGALGAGSLCKDPKFVSPAWGNDGDYHLADGSPAINAGTTTDAPTIDLAGNPRPEAVGIDLGCYER